MGNIVLLDELTINKIAAGEVIERPASAVKEMIENSIDAGANKITVEIKNGGISFIKVTDNGKGIASDDLEMAFERHATSKIRTADDLDKVTSMGFRGEALASIAAIANVEVVSKPEVQAAGYKVIVSGGNVLGKKEVGTPVGTSITVTDLFFNTPVRYKFLKKDYTERGYIEEVITKIALVHPEISFKLINAGKTVIQTIGNGNLKDVIYSIYGKDIANAVLPVKYMYEGIEIEGVIGKPEIARSNRTNQMFFVNKRNIKDKTLSSAVAQGFKGLIPLGKFGFVILNLNMNPEKVDVNVHPAKLEVRFEEENKVFQAVYHSIKDTLLKADLISKAEIELNEKLSPSEVQRQMSRRDEKVGLFGKNRSKEKIEKYTEEESQMKTNNLIEEIYNKHKEAQNILKDEGEKYEPESKPEPEPKSEISKYVIDNKFPDIPDLDDMEITEEKISELDAKVANLLGDAKKIREKNEKIISGEYVPESNSEEEVSKSSLDDAESEIERKLQELRETIEKEKEQLKVEEPKPEEENEEQIERPEENEDIPKALRNFKEENETKESFVESMQEEPPKEVTEEFKEMYAKLFGTVPKTKEDIEKEKAEKERKEKESAIDIVKDNVSIFENEEEFTLPDYKFIGIAFKTYIILEMDKELYIIDQHAAHERIMYEKVKQNYYSETNKDSQMLLLPDVITLTHKEMNIAKENMDMFKRAGFELEEFGENTIKLTGCPTVCIDINTKELFLETLDEINTVARTAKQEKEEKFIATVACKAAVKANMALDEREVTALMNQLLRLPNPFTCPHGRPTAIKMTQYDIERKFSRK